MRHFSFLVSATLGLSLLTSLANAEPTDSERDTARELMSQGRKQRGANDLAGALKSFSAANDIMHVPTTLFEVAATQAAIGRLLDAKDTLKRIAAFEEQKDEPDAFKKARQSAEVLARSVDQRIPTLQLSFAGDIGSDPSVTIDGLPLPDAEDRNHIRLDPGTHTISATSDAGKGKETVTLSESETRLITVSLNNRVASGEAEPETHAAPHLAHTSRPSSWPVYALSGLSLAALGTGIAFGAEADHTKSSLQQSCAPRCTSAQADRVHHWSTAANVSFGVSAAALTSAIIVYLVQSSGPSDDHRSSKASSFGLQVAPTAQGATLGAVGTF